MLTAFFESPSSTYSLLFILHSDSETPIPTLYIVANHELVICKPTVQKETAIPSPRQFHRILSSYQVVQSLPLPGEFYSTGIHITANLIALVYHRPQSNGIMFIDTELGLMQEMELSVCEIARIDANSGRS